MVSETMRVLLLNTSFRVEGPSKTFHEIAKRASGMGIELVAGALAGRGPMERIYRRLGVRTVYFGRPGGGALSIGSRVSRFVKRNDIDIIHCQLLRGEVVGALAAAAARPAALLSTVQNEDPYRKVYRNPPKAFLSRWALGRSDAVVVVSHALSEFVRRFQGITDSKIRVIPNAVDPTLFMTRGAVKRPRDLPRDGFLIGCVGRFAAQKGQEYLIRAFQESKTLRETCQLVLIGDGPDRKRLGRLALRGGCRNSMLFLGWRHAVNKYFPFFDVYVQPSRWEGMPFAAMEAMASGVPVVATRVGGLPELIENLHHGLLVTSGNVRELREAIERLMSDSELRKRLSHAGRRRIHREYRADQMAASYGRLYTQMANRKH